MTRCGFFTVKDIYTRPRPASRTVASQLYLQVIQAIPSQWRSLCHGSQTQSPHWSSHLCIAHTSASPLYLCRASTGDIYLRLVTPACEHPVSQEEWASSSRLSKDQWEFLWSVYILDPLIHSQMFSLSFANGDTIDHCFERCSIWKDVLQRALRLLQSLSPSLCFNVHSHILDLLLSRGCPCYYFILLVVTFWQKRQTLPSRAIIDSFKWSLQQYIHLTGCNRKFLFLRTGLLLL
jgi:hypothetical protein